MPRPGRTTRLVVQATDEAGGHWAHVESQRASEVQNLNVRLKLQNLTRNVMKHFCCLVLACAGSLALATGAAAQAPTLHERTMQIPGTQCSVTAWDYFTTVNGTYTMEYGGGTSCAGNVGRRTLNVVPQVFNLVNGEPLWFSIGGDGLYQGPTPMSPLRLSGSRTAGPSHIYRLLAYGQVMLPNGNTSPVTVCAWVRARSPNCPSPHPVVSSTQSRRRPFRCPGSRVLCPSREPPFLRSTTPRS
jgi:hypothetical protein